MIRNKMWSMFLFFLGLLVQYNPLFAGNTGKLMLRLEINNGGIPDSQFKRGNEFVDYLALENIEVTLETVRNGDFLRIHFSSPFVLNTYDKATKKALPQRLLRFLDLDKKQAGVKVISDFANVEERTVFVFNDADFIQNIKKYNSDVQSLGAEGFIKANAMQHHDREHDIWRLEMIRLQYTLAGLNNLQTRPKYASVHFSKIFTPDGKTTWMETSSIFGDKPSPETGSIFFTLNDIENGNVKIGQTKLDDAVIQEYLAKYGEVRIENKRINNELLLEYFRAAGLVKEKLADILQLPIVPKCGAFLTEETP